MPESAEKERAEPVQFTTSDTCASCHQAEYREWKGSHHQLAMQIATNETVLGDFSNASLTYFGTQARFSRHGSQFLITLDHGNSEMEEFRITHTFGVTPLQQYLVDTSGGRKQALQYAWDSRPRDEGGQRWFHLYNEEHIKPDDPLHWTGRYFNWNYSCAECHSTNLVTGYNLDNDTFDTVFSEISVGCEACHGPGSFHIQQAINTDFDETHGLPIIFNDRENSGWSMNSDTGIAERLPGTRNSKEPEACGRCHSRRGVVSASYAYDRPLTDTHMPALLEENLYYADGRILDEVYVYGSFLQSKMYAAGVTCTDCHNPHSGQLQAGPDPNQACSSCHLPSKFAAVTHAGPDSAQCVDCHMPATTYMGVDDRRDHSFRLPDTATDPGHYGAIIASGRQGNANEALLKGIANEDYPPIARATMLSLLETIEDSVGQSVLMQQLDNPDPLIRIGALRALRRQAPEMRLRYGSHLLRDPIRSVRVEAIFTYLDFIDYLPPELEPAVPQAINEYRESMLASASMPESALNLAEFETRLGNEPEASRLYKHAIRIGADLATVQHAYGLYLVRLGETSKALEHLRRATEIDHEQPRYVYVYGVALNSERQPEAAISVLKDALVRFEDNFDIAWALATILRDTGQRLAALTVVKQMQIQFPGNRQVDALAGSLQN
ncbi:MAG: hypothetical protein HKN15_13635 [Xanthomonadales bacterium]|nr:hypothetical protein [Xanthomonadales bacterium]